MYLWVHALRDLCMLSSFPKQIQYCNICPVTWFIATVWPGQLINILTCNFVWTTAVKKLMACCILTWWPYNMCSMVTLYKSAGASEDPQAPKSSWVGRLFVRCAGAWLLTVGIPFLSGWLIGFSWSALHMVHWFPVLSGYDKHEVMTEGYCFANELN